MKRIEVIIDGTAYPCAGNMGAMLRFKEITGRDINTLDASSVSDVCTYLWCCVASQSRKEGVKFDMSLMDFADSISPEDMAKWNLSMNEGDDSAEKKRAAKRPRK